MNIKSTTKAVSAIRVGKQRKISTLFIMASVLANAPVYPQDIKPSLSENRETAASTLPKNEQAGASAGLPANQPQPPDLQKSLIERLPTESSPKESVEVTPYVNADVEANQNDGFQLSFVDTDIGAVAGTILGDGLGLPYLIDPQIKGTMTLQATRPLSKVETLAALEAALRIQGAALVSVNGVYNVVPIKDAVKRVTSLRTPGQTSPGFSIYVVPMKYIGVSDMEKVLQLFAPEGGVLRVDAGRNLVLLAGTAQEIANLLSIINTFDVDWLADMSFAMYPLEYVDAKTLTTELGEIFSDSKSPIAGVVKLVPLTRLNTILVITAQKGYLTQVESWIKRLDVASQTPGRRIYVYDVQNGKADDLAKSLASILSISAAGATGTNTSNSTVGGASGTSIGGTQATNYSANSSLVNALNGTDASNVKIVPNSENNVLLIMASPSEYSLIEATLKKLDVAPIQVLIEASIAEVTLTDDFRFGIQWSYDGNQGPVILSEASGGTINQQFPGLSFLYTGRADISAVLNTISSLTNVRVLSSPKLLVLNNREAELQIGDQVPIVTQSSVSTTASTAPVVNTVQLRDTGVIMRVTPRANKGGRIFLEVAQEVSNVVQTTTSGIDSPTIQQRKLASVVSVEDGETVALGGLIKESDTKTRSGVPLLSRIPLLGALFGSTDKVKLRTELMVLITPRIIRSSDETRAVTSELQQQFIDLKRYIPTVTKSAVESNNP